MSLGPITRESAAMENEELLAFAEEVRRVTGRSLARITMGKPDSAVVLLAALCKQAESILAVSEMEEEVSSEDRYNLSQLSIDLQSGTEEE
jgi:hypothetical protein